MLKKIRKILINIQLIIIIMLILRIEIYQTITKTNYTNNNITYNTNQSSSINSELLVKEEPESEIEIKEVTNLTEVIAYSDNLPVSFQGTMTGYGPDCQGCSGIVACSPYPNVKNNNIYFEDKEFNRVRIIAADSKIPCGTIIKISNLLNYDEFYAIVLDRGSAIKNTLFDLLFVSEKDAEFLGRANATYTIVRWGW